MFVSAGRCAVGVPASFQGFCFPSPAGVYHAAAAAEAVPALRVPAGQRKVLAPRLPPGHGHPDGISECFGLCCGVEEGWARPEPCHVVCWYGLCAVCAALASLCFLNSYVFKRQFKNTKQQQQKATPLIFCGATPVAVASSSVGHKGVWSSFVGGSQNCREE